MSDKELKKAIDNIQPGSCFGHYDKIARECKTCFVVEQCSKNTASRELADSSDEEEKPEVKKKSPSVKRKYTKKKEEPKAEVKEVPKVEVKEVPKVEIKEVQKVEIKEVPNVTGNSFFDAALLELESKINLNEQKDSAKLALYFFGRSNMIVAYSKASGNVQLSKSGEKTNYKPFENKEDAAVLKKDMLVDYED